MDFFNLKNANTKQVHLQQTSIIQDLTLSLPNVVKGKFRPNFHISFSKILTNKWHHVKVQAESFHLNGHIIRFRLQTQALESPYKTPSSTLAVKGLKNASGKQLPCIAIINTNTKGTNWKVYFTEVVTGWENDRGRESTLCLVFLRPC